MASEGTTIFERIHRSPRCIPFTKPARDRPLRRDDEKPAMQPAERLADN